MQVETQQKKVGQFTALFAVGAFLPTVGDKEAAAGLAEFVSGGRKVPIDTYFIDSQSAAFLQAAPEGKQLCENLNFLGGFGIREIHGLTVAYLSGIQEAQAARRRQRADAAACDGVLRQQLDLKTPYGSVEVVVLKPTVALERRVPAVLVNVGCYYALAETLEKAEGPRYISLDCAYIIWRATGPIEEVADLVFQRWQADAAVVLDWLGQQTWCNGRVGCHGYSLLGNTSYATLAASHAKDAPKDRPLVCALVPVISFSRIHPTVFVNGQSLAAELALRFIWLAEVGLRQDRQGGFGFLWNMFRFFSLEDWPGLDSALAKRPVSEADSDLWGRPNVLWRGGQTARGAADPFWAEGRDVQCHFADFREPPSIHVIAGWNDMFLAQSLQDFQLATQATNGAARLTIFTGGHFGVVVNHGAKVAESTRQWYRQNLIGTSGAASRAAVRMQLIQEDADGGEAWLECDVWPPPSKPMQFFFQEKDAGLGTGLLLPGGPGREAGALSYVYDPKDPTPYAGDGWLNLQKDGAQDQRSFESSRLRDVLVLTSAPLQQSLEIVGEVSATLYVSCAAPECDIIVRLCAVREPSSGWGSSEPGFLDRILDPRGLSRGSSVNLCEDIVRVKFQKDSVSRVDISVGVTACHFRAGDAVRLHVCSAAHPRWLRHPLQDEKEDWLLGGSEVGPPATVTVFADHEHPSHVTLPVRSSAVRMSGSL
ncbi:cocE [Symbiodinium sp. KB8]|nr:cocE [Symbiodinium sp. KB8]